MVSVTYNVSQYRQEATAKQSTAPRKFEPTFVPTLVDLQTPVRKVRNVLQWRRRLNDYLGSFISGAVSLR